MEYKYPFNIEFFICEMPRRENKGGELSIFLKYRFAYVVCILLKVQSLQSLSLIGRYLMYWMGCDSKATNTWRHVMHSQMICKFYRSAELGIYDIQLLLTNHLLEILSFKIPSFTTIFSWREFFVWKYGEEFPKVLPLFHFYSIIFPSYLCWSSNHHKNSRFWNWNK